MSIFDYYEPKEKKIQIGVYMEESLLHYLDEACKITKMKRPDFMKMCIKEGVNQIFNEHGIKTEKEN